VILAPFTLRTQRFVARDEIGGVGTDRHDV
jgi:hypothetical protein